MIELGKAVFARLENFFFGPLRVESIVICRMVFGLCLFFHYSSLASHHQLIFGPDGFAGHRFYEHFPQGTILARPSSRSLQLLREISSPTIVSILFYILIVSSLFFAMGFLTRLTGFIAFVLHLIFHAQNEYVFWGWGDLIVPFMLYIIFSESTKVYALDNLIFKRNRRSEDIPFGSAWPVRLLQIHVCVVYLVAAWARLDDPNWRDGSMMYGILTDPRFGRIDSDWRFALPILRVSCYTGWFIEMFAPVFLWIPFTRMTVVILLALLHIGLEALTMVGYWDFIMLAALSTFIFSSAPKMDGAAPSRL